MDLTKLMTETRNTKSMNLDQLSSLEILKLMNEEDLIVAKMISEELESISIAVEKIIEAFNNGGRLIYFGAGTSGRLGILDAVECVPTFSVDESMVVGLIAGGDDAMMKAVEGAEDSMELGVHDLKSINLRSNDIVVGLSASGRTPYVIGGLKYASEVGSNRVTISCNKNSEISEYANYSIEVSPGPEILTGSTRLKAGTVQKIILNMLSTVSMIGIGKVYQNLMVDVKPTNLKLEERSKRIIMDATDCSYEIAQEKFYEANMQVKLAIVMILTNSSKDEAILKLEDANGFIRKTLI